MLSTLRCSILVVDTQAAAVSSPARVSLEEKMAAGAAAPALDVTHTALFAGGGTAATPAAGGVTGGGGGGGGGVDDPWD